MKSIGAHPPRATLDGARAVLAGLFPAKPADHDLHMDRLAERARRLGATIVGRVVQRRGVSHGGVHLMGAPLSRTTILGRGKAVELARLVCETAATVVIMANPLTERQREALQDLTGCAVHDGTRLWDPPESGRAADRKSFG
ncbi:hypothetical protein [Stackebrandtia soli]|uniref:HflX-like GTP-binding protein n=1 Tax=Stackebrandtia soli TaxID=1892856 RepID=UPI0039ECCCE4